MALGLSIVSGKYFHADSAERPEVMGFPIEGVVLEDFPITLPINKQTDDGKKAVPVTYYPLLVQSQVDDWPEKEQRERHWALLSDATKVTYREDYQGLISLFSSLTPWIKEAAGRHR